MSKNIHDTFYDLIETVNIKGNVIINGTFDILHPGHILLLSIGAYVSIYGIYKFTVAIDSDERIKKLKGNDRPVLDQHSRKYMLKNIKDVMDVQIFNSDQELVDIIRGHDYMIKGDDYKGYPVIGSTLVKDIIYVPRLDFSTTKILSKGS